MEIDRRNARTYLVGVGASVLGDSALTLVAGIWVKELTGSSATAALVAVCIYAPALLAPLAGLLADRVRRRPLLIGVNLAMAAAVSTLVLVTSDDQVWLVFIVMTLYGAALVVTEPAETALFVAMLPLELRQRLNGLRLTLTEGGKLTAPLLGAGLFALVGGAPVAALDAATFVVVAVVVRRLQVTERGPAAAQSPGWSAQVLAGYRHVWHSAHLRPVVIGGAVAMAVSGLGVAAQYSLVDALGRSPAFLGVLTAALGAGSIVAGLTSSALIDRIGERRLALVGLAAFAVGNMLRATGLLPAAVTGSAVLGFALPWIVLAVINVTQRGTPGALQGRVAALVTLALFAPQPVTQALGAVLIGPLGYRAVLAFMAVVAALAAGYLVRAES